MALITLIYASSAVGSLKKSETLEILKTSRENNGRKGIGGMLLFKDGNFMQVLEGDSSVVDELYLKISRDPRHTGLITLVRRHILKRSFSDWKMGFKDLGDLTQDEKAAHSNFLDIPLNDVVYASSPDVAFKLLESFKKTVR